MASIELKLQQLRQRIDDACTLAQRPVQSVTLLAVSKTQSADAVRRAHDAGQRAFGENYVQEALGKMEALADLRSSIEWHLIGPLQSNKTREVGAAFDWVHTVDRLKIAERLSAQRPDHLPPLQVCVQVNVSGEASKAGVDPADVMALAQAISTLPRLRLRGLMSIPEPVEGVEAQRAPHRRLRDLFDALRAQGMPLDTLSMGMSADLGAAIAEGSTTVRIGSALFGARPGALLG
jgi:PLP dependent protein